MELLFLQDIIKKNLFVWPGSVLLSHALRRSTISAVEFHGRVRNGVGCITYAITAKPDKQTTFCLYWYI
jgi:hypothetical protein